MCNYTFNVYTPLYCKVDDRGVVDKKKEKRARNFLPDDSLTKLISSGFHH